MARFRIFLTHLDTGEKKVTMQDEMSADRARQAVIKGLDPRWKVEKTKFVADET